MKLNMPEFLAYTTSDDWDNFVKKLQGVQLTFKKLIVTNRKVSGEEIFHCAKVYALEKLTGILFFFFFQFTQPQILCAYSGMSLGDCWECKKGSWESEGMQ